MSGLLSQTSDRRPASEGLRDIADWLDLMDDGLFPLIRDLIEKLPFDEAIQNKWRLVCAQDDTSKQCQEDLRRWADELEILDLQRK